VLVPVIVIVLVALSRHVRDLLAVRAIRR